MTAARNAYASGHTTDGDTIMAGPTQPDNSGHPDVAQPWHWLAIVTKHLGRTMTREEIESLTRLA